MPIGSTRNMNIGILSDESVIDHNSLLNYDADEHRKIDDTATGEDDLWSAYKIDAEFDAIDVTIAALDAAKLENIVEDTTPQLGGNLDINSHTLTGFTASRALEINASGNLQVSAVTSTELNYLDGVTSAIQTQINGKIGNVVEDTTPQLGGNLDGQAFNIETTGKVATDQLQLDETSDPVSVDSHGIIYTKEDNKLYFIAGDGTKYYIDITIVAGGVDSEAKRRSVTGLIFLSIYPVADGTIAASDRAHATGMYSGISY